ncbi:MAG: YHS domain-containing (seleno)protein [Opitutales bacterium]
MISGLNANGHPVRPLGLPFLFLVGLGLLVAAIPAWGFRPIHVEEDTRLALAGYDVVAYHKMGKAVKGVPFYQTTWKGAVWRFRSRQHLEAFRKNPGAYAPVYGGYCAVSIAAKDPVGCDPTIFVVRQGRLYVFASEEHRQAWLENPEALEKKADPFYRQATEKTAES